MRTRQIAFRVRRLLPPVLLACGTPVSGTFRPLAAGLGVEWAPQSGPQPPPHDDSVFRAVGRTRAFPSVSFWRSRKDGLLFLFHLHGFAELARYSTTPATAAGDRFWSAVVADWLAGEERPHRDSWHPYPLSRRLVAWSAALSRGGWDAALENSMRRSMARQLVLLGRSIEHDIGGNHVLHNGVALVIAGACLGDERRRDRGWHLLERELPSQLLHDGGHEERSTAYHRELLERVEDLVTLAGRDGRCVPSWLSGAASRMRAWLAAVAGPDGDLPLLNDAWEGPPVTVGDRTMIDDMSETGLIVVRHGRDQALFDAGPFAARHLPAHGHADALSFLLWIDGRPIVVDRGVAAYSGPERARFRGTTAHNTVKVAGQDQCDLWGDFRAAHVPVVRRIDTRPGAEISRVVAEHDGYARLNVVHRRTFVWAPGAGVVVVDRLAGSPCSAESRLHFAPGLTVTPTTAGPVEVGVLGPGGPPVLEHDRHAPFVGVTVAARTLARAAPGDVGVPFGWSLLRPGNVAMLDGGSLTIRRADGSTATSTVG